MLPPSHYWRRNFATALSNGSYLRRNNAEVHRRAQSSLLNSLVARVRVPHFTPTTCQLLPFLNTPPPPIGVYSQRKRILHTNSRADITPAVELLRLHVAWYINPNYTARFVATLETSAGAELRIEGWLAGGTGGRGDVEGVAAGGCAADAAEVGDVPGPVCATGEGRCGCAGGEKSEGGDLEQHVECLGWVDAKSVGLVGVGFLSHYATRRLYRSTHRVSGDRGNIKRMSLS